MGDGREEGGRKTDVYCLNRVDDHARGPSKDQDVTALQLNCRVGGIVVVVFVAEICCEPD